MNPNEAPSALNRLFINPDEGRLRSGWRILLHASIWMTLSLAFGLTYFILGGTLETTLGLESLTLRIVDGLIIVLATWIARRAFDKRSLRSLGFEIDHRVVGDIVFGLALAFLLIGMIFILELSAGWLSIEDWAWNVHSGTTIAIEIVAGLVIFLVGSFSEELLSRGYQLQNMMESLPLPLALSLSAGFFSVLHVLNPNATIASMLGIFLAGLFLSLGWLWTGKLWLPIAFHLGWNFFLGIVFGFPVSGLQTFRLIHHTVEGPELLTGGSFGPEASLVMLPILVIGTGLMGIYVRWRKRGDTFAG